MTSQDVVLVTGAASGIGRAEAEAFHHAGARVALTDIDLAAAEAVATELGERATALLLDVTQPDAWDRCVAAIESDWGAVTVLVNNAGVFRSASLLEHDLDDWRRIIEVNLIGHLLGIRAVHPGMRRNGGGVILNTASTAGMRATPRLSAYGASKWAVRGLSRTAAVELAGDDIRVNTLIPGVIKTPLMRAAGFPERLPRQPLPNAGDPQDIAAMAVFLASPAAGYITGGEFIVDGGATA